MYANTYIRLVAFRVLAKMETWVSGFTLSLIHSFSLIIRLFFTSIVTPRYAKST